jgi:catechol 2,3-dioxygenase-like lactoylglutathione lyase family enzyme
MAVASWKDLCVDVNDPELAGPFWADTLGLELHHRADGMVFLTGQAPQQRVWLNRVPEPVTVKQRVHLDVHVGCVEEVLARGAIPQDLDSFRWQVLRDPEGGELCTFVRSDVPSYRLYEVVVDSARPHAIAAWWAEVLGAQLHDDEDGSAYVDGIAGLPFESVVFGSVPEAKTVKNRIHWDVDTTDVALLTGHGATVLREPDDEISWTVMADPEGNEFCAFLP